MTKNNHIKRENCNPKAELQYPSIYFCPFWLTLFLSILLFQQTINGNCSAWFKNIHFKILSDICWNCILNYIFTFYYNYQQKQSFWCTLIYHDHDEPTGLYLFAQLQNTCVMFSSTDDRDLECLNMWDLTGVSTDFFKKEAKVGGIETDHTISS